MTFLERIQSASSDHVIRKLLNVGNAMRPSGNTRRGWLTAARKRRTDLGVKPRLYRDIVKNDFNGRRWNWPDAMPQAHEAT
jgi:hypothetical protein